MFYPVREASDCLETTIGGVTYTWIGGSGAVIKSIERGVELDEVRMIGNIAFCAYAVDPSIWLYEISWRPQQEMDAQWVRDFKASVFV